MRHVFVELLDLELQLHLQHPELLLLLAALLAGFRHLHLINGLASSIINEEREGSGGLRRLGVGEGDDEDVCSWLAGLVVLGAV